MDLVYIFRLLLNRLHILLLIPLTAAILTGVLTFFSQKQYKSEARLSTGYTVSNKYSLNEEGFNQFQADMKFNNLVENIKSPILIGTLSYRLLLNDLVETTPFSEIEIDKSEDWLKEDYGLTRDSIISILRQKILNFTLLSSFDDVEKNIIELSWDYGYSPVNIRELLIVKRVNYTDYITIQYESQDPFLSAFVVNTLCSEFLRYNNIWRSAQTSESIEYLDTLARQKKAVMEYKSNELRAYKSRNKFLNFKFESESKIEQLKDTEAERENTSSNIRRINLSLTSINARMLDQNLNVKGEQGEIIELRNLLTKLTEKRRNNEGNYAQLSDSISVVRRQLNTVIAGSSKIDEGILDQKYALEVELKLEEEKLVSINNKINDLRNNVSSFATSEESINAMERELELATQEYLEIQQKLNDAIGANINSKDNIRVVVQAQPALEHQASGLILKAGFSFAGTFMLCVIAFVVMELLDTRLKSIDGYKRMIDMKLLGVIYQEEKTSNFKKLMKSKLLKAPVTVPFNQELRKIRFALTIDDARIILLTSLKPEEGKSYLMYHLAYSLGLIDKRVLIIDTNFRNNSFFKVKLKNHKQLTVDVNSLLPSSRPKAISDGNEEVSIFENFFLVPPNNDNVHILTHKNPKGTPSEVLSGKDFKKMLDTLIEKGIYDYIFLEGAAFNNYSDSLELSLFADKVITVFNAMEKYDIQDLYNLKSIYKLEEKIMGGILNLAVTQV